MPSSCEKYASATLSIPSTPADRCLFYFLLATSCIRQRTGRRRAATATPAIRYNRADVAEAATASDASSSYARMSHALADAGVDQGVPIGAACEPGADARPAARDLGAGDRRQRLNRPREDDVDLRQLEILQGIAETGSLRAGGG